MNNKYLNNDDYYTQISITPAIGEGILETNVNVKDILKFGDFGFGATAGMRDNIMILDGERISPKESGLSKKVAIAFLSFFKSDSRTIVSENINLYEIKILFKEKMLSNNIIQLMKIKGNFEFIEVSNFPKFNKPYPRLTPQMIDNDKNIERKNISGTLMGFWLPNFLKDINAGAGDLHLHFVSEDKKFWGHVLNCILVNGVMEISYKHGINIILPSIDEYYKRDFPDFNVSLTKRLEAWSKEGKGELK